MGGGDTGASLISRRRSDATRRPHLRFNYPVSVAPGLAWEHISGIIRIANVRRGTLASKKLTRGLTIFGPRAHPKALTGLGARMRNLDARRIAMVGRKGGLTRGKPRYPQPLSLNVPIF